jgi:hypothetical protein
MPFARRVTECGEKKLTTAGRCGSGNKERWNDEMSCRSQCGREGSGLTLIHPIHTILNCTISEE